MWYSEKDGKCVIPLKGKRGEGLFATVDPGSIPEIEAHSTTWHVDRHGYARAYSRLTKKNVGLHRVVMKFPDGGLNHISRDKTDNTKCNLELMSNLNNCIHSKCFGSSKYPGVYFDKDKGKWRAEVGFRMDGKRKTKRFPRTSDEKEAARMYRDYVLELGLITRQPECWNEL